MRKDIFQAIADPTRRAIIALVASQAMTSGAIAAQFNSSRQAVSKHLQVLTESKVLLQKAAGREVYYRLNPERMKEVDEWLDQFRNMWKNRFNRLDDILSTIN